MVCSRDRVRFELETVGVRIGVWVTSMSGQDFEFGLGPGLRTRVDTTLESDSKGASGFPSVTVRDHPRLPSGLPKGHESDLLEETD